MADELLYETPWLTLRMVREPDLGINGYVYSHEARCGGRIVALLPFKVSDDGYLRYLVRSEVTPCWSLQQRRSAITGQHEPGDIEDDAIRELFEEAGFTVGRDDLIPLGESRASKSSDTVYSLFSVDLTGQKSVKPLGDGSRLEAEGSTFWMTADELLAVEDPQVSVMYLRLSAFLFRTAGESTQEVTE